MTDESDFADALWARIDATGFATVYVTELRSLAAYVVDELTPVLDVLAAMERPERGMVNVRPAVELLPPITAALAAAARIRALISPPDEYDGPDDERRLEVAIHTRRAAWSNASYLGGVTLSAVRGAKARHSIEHFDAHLDRTAIRYMRNERADGYCVADALMMSPMDLNCFAGRNEMFPKVDALRVIDAPKGVYTHLGHRAELKVLHRECEAIRDAVDRVQDATGGGEAPRERFGGIIVLPPIGPV